MVLQHQMFGSDKEWENQGIQWYQANIGSFSKGHNRTNSDFEATNIRRDAWGRVLGIAIRDSTNMMLGFDSQGRVSFFDYPQYDPFLFPETATFKGNENDLSRNISITLKQIDELVRSRPDTVTYKRIEPNIKHDFTLKGVKDSLVGYSLNITYQNYSGNKSIEKDHLHIRANILKHSVYRYNFDLRD